MNELKLFYSTEEVAEYFGVAESKIRYYEKEFDLKIKSRGKNKAFTKGDMETIGRIIALLEEEKYTIAGAREQLKLRVKKEEKKEELLLRLNHIREVLVRLNS
ncbi:MerR family transcriptional regulator [Marinilongibacter aquaticus]|uniref:MerR family transcriptional regulator n=1 Tax=Marinilongibacter aquaticus TaxID=2975157 RepID=UPI0021BD7F7C|nr:MerR family transcriptional regulator [Marinilongibacter aquaticus]UBM59855.1 MerR family transcriptional regulator [Marinilongibacter aquaticus]